MIEIKANDANYGILFPESEQEISAETLAHLVSDIKLPKYYAIVALCFKTKLFDFAASTSNKSDGNLQIVPRLAAYNTDDKFDIKGNIGDKVVITRTSIERSVHINIPTMISSDNASKYLSEHKELLKSILNTSHEYSDRKIVVLQFKIVPIGDISATTSLNKTMQDPFVIKG